MKVYLKEGGEQWILIHIEVQGVNEEDFSKRMFQYFYRIFDRYEKKIAALAIMTSPYKNNYPKSFQYDFFCTTLNYKYTICKVFDYDDDMLRHSDSLFSKIILAAKYLYKTDNEEQKRYVFKSQLMRELIRNQSYSRLSVQAVLHFVDYLLKLPKELEQQLFQSIYPLLGEERKLMELYNKDNASPTIYNAFDLERIQGREEGILEARKSIARNLLKQKLALEAIIAATQLSKEEIEALQSELQ
ncbi:RpnC/YadD family protein [Sporosarcina cascadiensis]|uniref:hypothetical protein n=1 Tax=Sporosarcina cascadiensis TaxID=2660747 RepID=UPI00129B1783|nr:hypothetical protein [Sporosarcina cascadiensis]